MANQRELHVPDIGEFKNVPVIEVLVQAGDRIGKDSPVIVLETDKAMMEVPSTSEGVVREVRVKVGDRLSQGDLILLFEGESVGDAEASPATQSLPVAVAPPPAIPAPVMVTAPDRAAAQSTITVRQVLVPDIGDFKNIPVIEILVRPGDTVSEDAPLIALESDKATLEVPSPWAGVVRSVAVNIGDRLSQGDVFLTIETEGAAPVLGAAAPSPAKSPDPSPLLPQAAVAPVSGGPAPAAASPVPAVPIVAATAPPASPSLRKLARELGVDLLRVTPTGPRGRLQREDVERFVRAELLRAAAPAPVRETANGLAGLLPWPQIDFSRFGAIERQPLSRLRKISGANLSRNWVMIPHVTNFDEADITDLEAFRLQVNREQKPDEAKLTMLAFLIKASVEVLRRYPEYNASLDGEELILKRYFHIGFAADTPNGLVVPVIRDADRKNVREIAREAADLAAAARTGKLKPEQMQGGCFSVSSLGGIGGTGFTPIINAPEVAILGVTRAELKPKWDGTQFKPRLMLPLNLSWDHRVVDGASAARFLVTMCSLLADFRRVVL